MSWLSEFVHDPIEFIEDKPLKALALVGGPIAALAAPWAIPEIGGAIGLGEGAAAGLGAGEGILGGATGLEGAFGGAAGGTTAGEGLFGGLGLADAAGAGESLSAMAGLPEQGLTGDIFAGIQGGEGFGGTGGLGVESGLDAMAYAPTESVAGSVGGEAAPMGGASYEDFLAAGGDPTGSAGGTVGAAPESPGFFSKMGTNALNYVQNNPFSAAGAGIAGLGLGYNLLQGQKTSPNVAALQANAQAQSAQAKQLMSYFEKGQLPPGLQNIAKQMTQSMNAQAVANAAKNGLSTDPAQNTALANQLIANQERVFGWIAQQSMQLLNAGVQMSGLSNNLYAQLEQLDRQKSAQTGQAIANFAAALNGGGSGLYKKVA